MIKLDLAVIKQKMDFFVPLLDLFNLYELWCLH